MNENRAVYYGPNDVLAGINLIKIETIVPPSLEDMNINDAIELYCLKKYLDEDVRITTWTDEQFHSYKEKSKKLFVLTMRYFNSLSDENIVVSYGKLSILYCGLFWELFEKCKLQNKISDNAVRELLHSERVDIGKLFSCKQVVNKYGNALREYILENEGCIRLLLDYYEKDFTASTKIYLPKELTGTDIRSYINDYIDSEHVNTNLLDAIIHIKQSELFPITEEIKAKAKRRYKEEIEKMSKTGASVEYGFQITFDGHQEEEKKIISVGKHTHLSYSTKWLLETLDYPSILNNFIYIFDFVDIPQMRCLHVNKESLSSVLERAFQRGSSRLYSANFIFKNLNSIAEIQMKMYYELLIQNGIQYEDVLKWFFTEYLQESFGCPEMRVRFPGKELSYEDKCYKICAAFEAVIKQFTLFAKYRKIDFDMYVFMKSPRLFDIPSLVDNKYVYGCKESKEFNYFKFVLFSDQCMFSFIKRLSDAGKQYSSFYELISNEDVYLSDYRKNESASFRKLEEFGLLRITEEGLIKPGDIIKIAIVKDLFSNDVISRYHYPQDAQATINEWVSKRILNEKSSLLTLPEANFFDYVLNDSEYSNSLALRNKYSHGNEQIITEESEHKTNYLAFLRLFTILAIKINDDFCLYDGMNDNRIH